MLTVLRKTWRNKQNGANDVNDNEIFNCILDNDNNDFSENVDDIRRLKIMQVKIRIMLAIMRIRMMFKKKLWSF